MTNCLSESRAALTAALAQYKKTAEYSHLVIDAVPNRVLAFEAFLAEMERRISTAYEAGYKAGRKSK